MKKRMSMKECKNWAHVVTIPNCSAYYVLLDFDAKYYNCGTYGWNCDIWTDISRDLLICSGYRNTRGKQVPLDLVKPFDDRAQEIMRTTQDWEEIAKIREEFFDFLVNY